MSNDKKIIQNLIEKKNFDFAPEESDLKVNKNITLNEHEGIPRSYMVFNNLKNIIMDASELLSIMNENDDLPAWAQEMVSSAKMNLSKALDYVKAEKTEE